MNLGAARHSAARSSTPRRRRPNMRVDTDATSDARASLSPPNPTSPPPDPRRDDSPRSSRPEGNRRDALARPRLVIREVATRSKGRGRVKPRRAELETFAHVSPDDGSAVDPLASLPRVDGALRARPATFALPSPVATRRDAPTARHSPPRDPPRSPSRHAPRDAARRGHRGASHGPPAQVPALRHPRRRRPRPAVGLDRSRAARASRRSHATKPPRGSPQHRHRRTRRTTTWRRPRLRRRPIRGTPPRVGRVEIPISVLRRRRPRIRSSRGARGRGRAKMAVPRLVPRPGSQTPFRSRGGASQRARMRVPGTRAGDESRENVRSRVCAVRVDVERTGRPPLRRRRRPRGREERRRHPPRGW